MEKVQIKTKDEIELSALLWDVKAATSLLFLHMMPATKKSWTPLAEKLTDINVLAIDFRGHGESGGGNYQEFKPEQHYGYFDDVRAAAGFLQSRFPGSSIIVGGASIGANLALWYMAEHHDSPKGFALSAGLDYYGVRAIDYVKQLSAKQSILLVGSRDDGRKSGEDCGAMAEQLYEATLSKKDKIIYDTGGHGTDMWKAHPELVEKIVDFLISNT